MSKKKIYELANELNITSKELIEVGKRINLDIKSHLSVIDNEAEQKLINEMKKESKKDENKGVMKDKKDVKSSKEEPVIIRRAVIVEKENSEKKKNNSGREGVGKVQKNTHKDYNIVYREKQDKPLTVSELFGLNKKKEEVKEPVLSKKTNKDFKNEKVKNKEVVNEKKEKEEFNIDKFKGRTNKLTVNTLNREENTKPKNKFENSEKKNKEKSFDKKPKFVKENRENSEKKDFKKPFNKERKDFKDRNQTPKKETSVEMTDDLFKENNKASERKLSRQKDKEKEQNKLSEAKVKKSRNREEEEFDYENLNRLKHQGNLSGIIESGDIFDIYHEGRKSKGKVKKKKEKVKKEQAKLTNITIPENISVKDLAQALKVTASDLLMKLMSQGIVTTLNNSIDFDTAFILASEYGITATKKNVVSFEEKLFDDSEDLQEELEERPPVVVVMGHVDHGKTSLLDAVRNTNKAESEAGGITQHIGAYQVKANDKLITFLDTPGHEAFISMRARGAKATDIAILVVAANDGVMPQTIEAISHAKAAGIPVIVAVNKMDLPGANVDRIKQELIEHELVAEEWGGDTIFVPISAKTGEGIEELLEMVLLQAEVLELKVNKNKQAKGTVLESRLDKSRGPVVSMLVNRGVLNVGDTIIVGTSIGRIRTMIDHNGKSIKKAYPSTPVEVTGVNSLPESGSTFYEVSDEKTAKKLIEKRESEEREKRINSHTAITLENLFDNINKGNAKVLNIVVKADVSGTAEAVKKSLEMLSTEEVIVKVIHSNVGVISETDVNLAKVAGAIIIGFNVRPDQIAKELADKSGVEIKLYSVIYNAIDDVKNAMIGMLDPEYREVVIGNVEVRATFKISKIGTIAGSYVTSGKVVRNASVRVIRDGIVLVDTKISSLKREKDDAKEVKFGYECGIQVEGFNDVQIGDIFEVYEIEEIKRKSLKG